MTSKSRGAAKTLVSTSKSYDPPLADVTDGPEPDEAPPLVLGDRRADPLDVIRAGVPTTIAGTGVPPLPFDDTRTGPDDRTTSAGCWSGRLTVVMGVDFVSRSFNPVTSFVHPDRMLASEPASAAAPVAA